MGWSEKYCKVWVFASDNNISGLPTKATIIILLNAICSLYVLFGLLDTHLNQIYTSYLKKNPDPDPNYVERIFNRPGVAGAVLQTTLSLIHKFLTQ